MNAYPRAARVTAVSATTAVGSEDVDKAVQTDKRAAADLLLVAVAAPSGGHSEGSGRESKSNEGSGEHHFGRVGEEGRLLGGLF